MSIKVSINRPQLMISIAMWLIEKMKNKNKLNFDLEIVFDYELTDEQGNILRGLYDVDKPYKIYINPSECEDIEEGYNQLFYCGYTDDLTLFGVTLHEFSHFIVFTLFPSIYDDYRHLFPTDRFYLNEYSDATIDEEIAEAMTLYLTNPYLLKLISKKHWSFFKKYFKSPVPASAKKFYDIYLQYPMEIKLHLKNKWGIVYNIETDKFEKTHSEAIFEN